MPPITTRHELTFHSGRMHPARARSSGSERLSPNRSSAAYTIDMHESDFSEATGAPRIHGELLKLGFEVAESTVSKYMIGRRGPPSQSWRTFLRNPCGRDCGDRSVRGSNPDLRAAVCLSCCRLWTAATAVVCGDPQSVGGMAGSTDGRGIPLEHGAHLFGARQ